jgi:hypothetical protein
MILHPILARFPAWCRVAPAVLGVCAATMPLPAVSQEGGDAERVVAVVRELFPEIESQAALPVVGGQPAVRLVLSVGYDKARARAKGAFEGRRFFADGSWLSGFGDRVRTRDASVGVKGAGGIRAGSFVLSRAGRTTVVEVFLPPAGTTEAMPARRALPDPVMWLFPIQP